MRILGVPLLTVALTSLPRMRTSLQGFREIHHCVQDFQINKWLLTQFFPHKFRKKCIEKDLVNV